MSFNRYNLTVGTGVTAVPEASLLYISTAKYGRDWHSIPHTHGCTELFYVVTGRGAFHIGEASFPVGEGDLVIVEPNTEHTETSLHDAPLEYIVAGIQGISFQNGMSGPVSFRGASTNIVGQLRSILRESREQAPGYEQVCNNLLNALLVQVARHIGLRPDAGQRPSAGRDCSAARRYIEAHYRESLSLDILARALHLSKYHLVHIFSREYGVSPMHYVQQLRLRECRDLLRTTDYSVAQIARITGFSSPSYFSQRFSKAEGMTPAQYRHNEQHKKI